MGRSTSGSYAVSKVYLRYETLSFWRTRPKRLRRRLGGMRRLGSGKKPVRTLQVQ